MEDFRQQFVKQSEIIWQHAAAAAAATVRHYDHLLVSEELDGCC